LLHLQYGLRVIHEQNFSGHHRLTAFLRLLGSQGFFANAAATPESPEEQDICH